MMDMFEKLFGAYRNILGPWKRLTAHLPFAAVAVESVGGCVLMSSDEE
jgi:hypothetical protein